MSTSTNPTEKPSYPYKKTNHFIEFLKKYNKEDQDLSDICSIVDKELQEQNIDRELCNVHLIKDILKKHGLVQYYEYSYKIYCKITGKSQLELTDDERQRIIDFFNKHNNNQDRFVSFNDIMDFYLASNGKSIY